MSFIINPYIFWAVTPPSWADKGWFGGWNTWSATNEIDWLSNINTTTPTSQNPSATLATARWSTWTIQNTDKWFYCWWYTWSSRVSEIDWLDSTDTNTPSAVNPSATLAVARSWLWSFSWDNNYWFCVDWFNTTPVNVTEVDWLSSTDTTTPSAINPSATMTFAKRDMWSCYSSDKWFVMCW